MSKSIYICSRKPFSASVNYKLLEICKRLAPDNITPHDPRIVVSGDIAYGIMNPNNTLLESGKTLLMGQIFDKDENWNFPLHDYPDGSYALFRDGKEHCEIVSDPSASRTIWYYKDENLFIASTSQRAIVMFLGSFEFDERVIPWMLSTGTLGPIFSWDKRIKRVPADSSVILNKNTWTISSKSKPIEFNLVKRSDEQHEKHLKESLTNTFSRLNIDYSKWLLQLSGGIDSRGILCLLRDNSTNIQDLRTITWGLESALNVKGNDAYVAKKVAGSLNVPHKYYHTDLSGEPINTIINRFILLGEGRIDHLAAYMDGFKIWKTLFEDGIQGTIRGDEGFGYHEGYPSLFFVRKLLNCRLCSDFSNLKDYRKYGFPIQELPQNLNKRKGETLELWRDRLFHEYRLPNMLAALSDLKFSYLEQINPYLSRHILQQVRQLPDHLRTEKALFKKIVVTLSPEVEYATSEADASDMDLLKMKQIVNLIKQELTSNEAKVLFPNKFLDFVLSRIKTNHQLTPVKSKSFSIKSSIRRISPLFIKKVIRKVVLPKVDSNVLAFRIFLIINMNKILNADCKNEDESFNNINI